jgi:hypothetical protein
MAAMLLALVGTEPATAAIEPIVAPDADYQEATTKIDLSEIPIGTAVSSITDGTLTVTFRPGPADHDPDRGLRVYKDSVPGGWASWSSPPFSEEPLPHILINENLSLIIDLSIPITTFGFELEPSLLSPTHVSVAFLSVNGLDETVLGTIELDVENRSGARLFAATTETIPFNRVVIRADDYFAMAQFRYAVDAECLDVDVDVKPGNDENVIDLSRAGSIPVAILSNDDPFTGFDATTVDPTTVCFGHAGDPRQFGDCTADRPRIKDVNGDGLPDLALRFDVVETGIQLGDSQACLMGKTFSGVCIKGCDKILTKSKKPRRGSRTTSP